jgi:hypothetical protein
MNFCCSGVPRQASERPIVAADTVAKLARPRGSGAAAEPAAAKNAFVELRRCGYSSRPRDAYP